MLKQTCFDTCDKDGYYIIQKIYFIGRVFSTEKLFPTRVPQYWANGVKGRCKGDEYSKTPKKP